MKRSQILLGTAALAGLLTSCDGLREAFTAHVDTVARAGGQELSTERLAKLIGESRIPVQKDVAAVVADFWVSYQLLGYSGAHADALPDSTSKNWWLADHKSIDEAMWASINSSRVQKFYDQARKNFGSPDTTALDQKYLQSDALAAQHILIMMPQDGAGMSEQKKDSIRKAAEAVRVKVTAANFGEMAKKYSEDPGSKNTNGTYAMFPAGQMVPEFEQATRALKPGEISPALVKTQHGYHIIRRHLLSEVHPQFVQYLMESNEGTRQKEWVEKNRGEYKGAVKPEAIAKIREVAKMPTAAREDRTVLGTSRVGDFTAARLARWLEVMPPQMQVPQRLATGPDSVVVGMVRSIMDQEILATEAKKQGIDPDTAELKQIRGYFATMVKMASTGLGVDPQSLGDSAKTTSEKERLAASRVEQALDQLFATNGQRMVEISPQLSQALRARYPSRVNTAGLDRAVERATAIRAAADSVRAKQMQDMPPTNPVPPPSAPPTTPPGKGGRG